MTSDLGRLFDEAAIRRVVDEIDNAVDAKDWAACRGYFLDEIDVDFTSLAGGSPARMAADDLIAAWATNLYREKSSFHMRSNHRVTIEGDRADVVSRGYALNILQRGTGSDLWEVWGVYVHTMRRRPEGWRCSGMTLEVVYARGNEKVREFVPES
ncbi:MAG: nuclear transport factor 2 family protein [Chloroflexia bacterium]|nr:nuclear transport factor 2 family protein [Chloroflexia bacterium]